MIVILCYLAKKSKKHDRNEVDVHYEQVIYFLTRGMSLQKIVTP
jgi:hypothetical protein